MSMRLRLMLSFAGVVIVAILGVVLAMRLGNEGQVQDYLFRGGMMGLEEVVRNLENSYKTQGNWQGAGAIIRRTGLPSDQPPSRGRGPGEISPIRQRLRLADKTGLIVADNSDAEIGGKLSSTELATSIQLKGNQNELIGYLLSDDALRFTQGVEQPLIERLNNAAILAGIAALVLALILAFLLSQGLLRPIGQLTTAAERTSNGDLTQQVPVRGKDELSRLALAFNHMTQSLRQSEQRRKAISAEIAHELRTPLAVQRAHLEALQDGVYPLTIDNLQTVIDQNQLLARLVNDLVTLSLADAGQLHLEKTGVNLVDLCSGVVDQFQPQADARQVRLALDAPTGSTPLMQADPDRLAQILNNLLTNALRYTPSEGQIQINLTFTEKQAQIQVKDTGPGIPEAALPLIFERFYRVDKARARNEGGSGLGLAIARQLAAAHGGELTAANNPDIGAVFTLKLPV